MKTLLWALGATGHGTKRLSKALADIGLEGGHEVIGQGNYGSVCDVQPFILETLKNSEYESDSLDYMLDAHFGSPGDGDGKLAELFFKWVQLRYSSVIFDDQVQFPDNPDVWKDRATLWHECEKILFEASLRFLYGDPTYESDVFFDINRILADFYPIIQQMYPASRCIHLTIDARTWIQKLMYYQAYTLQGCGHYGPIHNESTHYLPSLKKDEHLSRFEQACWYWARLHNWFLLADVPQFKVEDFNKPETAQCILHELYPEAMHEQRASFTLEDDRYVDGARDTNWHEGEYGFPRWQDWDADMMSTFNLICGETMKKLGYYGQ